MNLLTKKETASKLKASTRTIENWTAQGIIPAPIYICRRALWVEEAIDTWLQQKTSQQTSRIVGPSIKKPGRPRKT